MDTPTSTSLLNGLRDSGNAGAWARFMERYQPLVIAFAFKQGLGHADAEDVGQETLLAFVKRFRGGDYERQRGRLHSWLFGIAYHKAVDILRQRAKMDVASARADGTVLMNSIPSQEQAEAAWEEEWRSAVLRACLDKARERVQAKTFHAFELYVLKQRPPDEVAQHLGMTVSAVYLAKNRVVSHVRETWPSLEEIY